MDGNKVQNGRLWFNSSKSTKKEKKLKWQNREAFLDGGGEFFWLAKIYTPAKQIKYINLSVVLGLTCIYRCECQSLATSLSVLPFILLCIALIGPLGDWEGGSANRWIFLNKLDTRILIRSSKHAEHHFKWALLTTPLFAPSPLSVSWSKVLCLHFNLVHTFY